VKESALRDDVWRKSSYSADSGACVEIARKSPRVLAVRDSMDAGGPLLFFTLVEWKTFTCQLKNVGFDGG
jgi:Domain of unknown function (DUF397)